MLSFSQVFKFVYTYGMKQTITITPIAYVRNGYHTAFAIPRQSSLAPAVVSSIVFTPEYASEALVRGLEQFSHLWLIWGFSDHYEEGYNKTVRPPRLGGKQRIGVFASRSPFRPNPLGLSAVKILRIYREDGVTVIDVTGADLKNGTPVFDIKPYIPYSDAIPEATGGFTEEHMQKKQVFFPEEPALDENIRTELTQILAQDPRPGFHHDPERIYGFAYGSYEVRFKADDTAITVISITSRSENHTPDTAHPDH